MKRDFANLKTLVAMQLKDKIDLSFVKSPRKTLFKAASALLRFLLSGGAFFLFFYLASLLKLFSFTGLIPTTLMTALFTLTFVLAVITCTAGLTQSLYLAEDNRILMTLPVKADTVFLSKLVLYVIFELKKNLLLLLPMYAAYGIVMSAVWYYYLWLLPCFFFVSLLPVAIAAVLSIPSLFAVNFVKRHKWLQLALIVATTAFVGWAFISLIGIMPENINIAGQWSSISKKVQLALADFAAAVLPLDKINLMFVGGTTAIHSQLITLDTLWGALITLGTTAVCLGLAYVCARPLFFSMASKQFEYEKDAVSSRKNKVRPRGVSPFVYEPLREIRSSRFVIRQMCGLLVLPIAIFLLNKTYAAMNTRLTGQYMTVGFSLLVSLLIVTSGNVEYSAILSVDGAARPISKTQPIIPQVSVVARLVIRLAVMIASVIASCCLWQSVAKLSAADTALLAMLILFVGVAHLMMAVESDVMNPQNEQYATVGGTLDNPNERNSTVFGFLMSFLTAFLTYFIMGEGQTTAILKMMLVALAFLAFRTYLLFTRIRLYYAEK